MNQEKNKKSSQPASNYEELPNGKVDKGGKAVKKAADQVYKKEPAMAKTKNPAKRKEESEQPVHSVKSN